MTQSELRTRKSSFNNSSAVKKKYEKINDRIHCLSYNIVNTNKKMNNMLQMFANEIFRIYAKQKYSVNCTLSVEDLKLVRSIKLLSFTHHNIS